jgi:hypothetical protein
VPRFDKLPGKINQILSLGANSAAAASFTLPSLDPLIAFSTCQSKFNIPEIFIFTNKIFPFAKRA